MTIPDDNDPFEIPAFLRRTVTPANKAAMARMAREMENKRTGKSLKNPRRRGKPTGLGMALKDQQKVKPR